MTALKKRVTLVREYGAKQYGDAYACASQLVSALSGTRSPCATTHNSNDNNSSHSNSNSHSSRADAAAVTAAAVGKLSWRCAALVDVLRAHDGLACYVAQAFATLLPHMLSLVRDVVTCVLPDNTHDNDNDEPCTRTPAAATTTTRADATLLTPMLQLCVQLVDGGVAAESLATGMATCTSSLVRLLRHYYSNSSSDNNDTHGDTHVQACCAARLLQQAVCAIDDADALAQQLLQYSDTSSSDGDDDNTCVLWRAARRSVCRVYDNDDDDATTTTCARDGDVCCALLHLLRDCVAVATTTTTWLAPLCALAQLHSDVAARARPHASTTTTTQQQQQRRQQREVAVALLLLLSTAVLAADGGDDDADATSLRVATRTLLASLQTSSSCDDDDDDNNADDDVALALARDVCALRSAHDADATMTTTTTTSVDADGDGSARCVCDVASMYACVQALRRSRFDAAARVQWLQRLCAHADDDSPSHKQGDDNNGDDKATASLRCARVRALHVLWLLPHGLRSVYTCACDVDEDVGSNAFALLARLLPVSSSSAAQQPPQQQRHASSSDDNNDDVVTRAAVTELLLLCGGGVVTLDDALADYSARVVTSALQLLHALLSHTTRTRHAALASRAVASVAQLLAHIADRDDCDDYVADAAHADVLATLARVVAQLRPDEAAVRVPERAVVDLSTIVARATAHVDVVRSCLRALVVLASSHPLAASMSLDFGFMHEQFALQLQDDEQEQQQQQQQEQQQQHSPQADNNNDDDGRLCVVNVLILVSSLDMLAAIVTRDARVIAFESIEVVAMALCCLPRWLRGGRRDLVAATCRCAVAMLRASDECRAYLLYDDVLQSIGDALTAATASVDNSNNNYNNKNSDDDADDDDVYGALLPLASHATMPHMRTHVAPALVRVACALDASSRPRRASTYAALLDTLAAAATTTVAGAEGHDDNADNDNNNDNNDNNDDNNNDNKEDETSALWRQMTDAVLHTTSAARRHGSADARVHTSLRRCVDALACTARVANVVVHALVTRVNEQQQEQRMQHDTSAAADMTAAATTRPPSSRLCVVVALVLHALFVHRRRNDNDDDGDNDGSNNVTPRLTLDAETRCMVWRALYTCRADMQQQQQQDDDNDYDDDDVVPAVYNTAEALVRTYTHSSDAHSALSQQPQPQTTTTTSDEAAAGDDACDVQLLLQYALRDASSTTTTTTTRARTQRAAASLLHVAFCCDDLTQRCARAQPAAYADACRCVGREARTHCE